MSCIKEYLNKVPRYQHLYVLKQYKQNVFMINFSTYNNDFARHGRNAIIMTFQIFYIRFKIPQIITKNLLHKHLL